MPEFLKKLQEKVVDFWKNMSKSQKIRLIVTAAVILATVIISLVVISRPTYVTLIKSDDTKQLKEITDSLTEEGIEYNMSDDGESILINEDDKSRAQVATLSFIQRGMDFEDAFNMIKLNSTESDKEMLWSQYKKNNLSSKLEAIANNIETADVDLDIPEKSPFVTSDDEEEKPTARVIVKPKGELTEENVRAIAMMVAGSVSGLDYNDVVVLDDNLNVLSKDSSDEGIGKLNDEEDMRLKKAKDLEKRVYTLYSGPADSYDSIKVVANPVMDFDTSKSVSKNVNLPEGMDVQSGRGLVVSENIEGEKAEGGGVAGVPGTDTNPADANTPTYPNGTTDGGKYNKDSNIINYDYNTKTTEEEKATGNLIEDRSSIALALYYGRKVTDDKKLSDAFIEDMKQGVSTATGVPVEQISVSKFKMAPLEEETKTPAETAKELFDAYGMFALILLFIVGLLIALKPKKKKEEEPQEEELPVQEDGVLLDEDEEPIQELDLEEKSEVKKQIDKFVRQKPEAVAQLLRNWLTDEWD